MRMRTVFSVRRTLSLPVALVAAVVVAEVAVLLFRPRDLGPAPLPVDARAYFSAAQLEKAENFRSGQLWLYGARLLIELGVLVVLVRKAPPRIRAFGERRPVLAGAATAAGISLVLGLAPLPVSAIARERAKDVGLVTQDWLGWVGDIAKSQAIAAVLWGAGGALLIFGMRKLGRRWWIAGSVVVVLFGVAITYASPVVLDPLFNKFTPLKEGRTRADVLELAKRAGIDVGQVYEMDASRRTTAANAYVAGLGHTKRVVLYDNLMKDFSPAEVRLVVAHELGHVRHRDVPHGLLWLALVAPAGMWAAALLAERLVPRGAPAVTAVPTVALAVGLVATPITMVSSQLSRSVERRADAFSLALTRDPESFIRFEKRIAVKNVADVEPPAWSTFLLASHPPTLERIGQGVAYERLLENGGAAPIP
jgi:Zn-dependent protease with chaperone function